jgi:hypothetical protein
MDESDGAGKQYVTQPAHKCPSGATHFKNKLCQTWIQNAPARQPINSEPRFSLDAGLDEEFIHTHHVQKVCRLTMNPFKEPEKISGSIFVFIR